MTRTLAVITAAALSSALALSATQASAAACRDAKGKFVNCPPAAAPKKVCKDAKGKFVKCTAAGAKVVGKK